jgi:hypothetical protein
MNSVGAQHLRKCRIAADPQFESARPADSAKRPREFHPRRIAVVTQQNRAAPRQAAGRRNGIGEPVGIAYQHQRRPAAPPAA